MIVSLFFHGMINHFLLSTAGNKTLLQIMFFLGYGQIDVLVSAMRLQKVVHCMNVQGVNLFSAEKGSCYAEWVSIIIKTISSLGPNSKGVRQSFPRFLGKINGL